MRNALHDEYGLSELDAEDLVDTLESRGFLVFEGNPEARSETDTPWAISTFATDDEEDETVVRPGSDATPHAI